MLTRMTRMPRQSLESGRPVHSMMDLLDAMFNSSESFVGSPVAYPPLNVTEDQGNVYVDVELPGVLAARIDVSMHGGELTISGSREEVESDAGFIRRERYVPGAFKRVLQIGIPINEQGVHAKVEHGILSITLPKAEAIKPRRVEISPA